MDLYFAQPGAYTITLDSGRANQKLDQILAQLGTLQLQEHTIMVELDTLTTQVKATTDAEASAIVLINGIADRIKAAGGDPAALAALSSSLKSNSDTLAAAVLANTPPAV